MILEPFPGWLPAEYRVKFATESWERQEAPRRCGGKVFCMEQRIFAGATTATTSRRHADTAGRDLLARHRAARRGRHRAHPRGRPQQWWGSTTNGRRRLSPHRGNSARLIIPPRRVLGPCPRLPSGSTPMCKARTLLFRRLHWRNTSKPSCAAGRITCRNLSWIYCRRSPTPRSASCRCPNGPREEDACSAPSRSTRLPPPCGQGRRVAAKRDIAAVVARLGVSGRDRGSGGRRKDCVPDGDGFHAAPPQGLERVRGGAMGRPPAGVPASSINIIRRRRHGGRPIAVVDSGVGSEQGRRGPHGATGMRAGVTRVSRYW